VTRMSWLFSLWTVLVCALFAAITGWALRRARQGEFDAAARIPLDDDRAPPAAHQPAD
jgi:cbb3-type cytochrome oxidase subunit 3